MSSERTGAEVQKLKTLLQYQDKAVVSRMLVKNSAGNVTLFAFDGNEGLSRVLKIPPSPSVSGRLEKNRC